MRALVSQTLRISLPNPLRSLEHCVKYHADLGESGFEDCCASAMSSSSQPLGPVGQRSRINWRPYLISVIVDSCSSSLLKQGSAWRVRFSGRNLVTTTLGARYLTHGYAARVMGYSYIHIAFLSLGPFEEWDSCYPVKPHNPCAKQEGP